MSDIKSKLPDFKELAAMTSKLYTDIKTSVGQIIQDYKDIRAQTGSDEAANEETKTEDTPTDNVKTNKK